MVELLLLPGVKNPTFQERMRKTMLILEGESVEEETEATPSGPSFAEVEAEVKAMKVTKSMCSAKLVV